MRQVSMHTLVIPGPPLRPVVLPRLAVLDLHVRRVGETVGEALHHGALHDRLPRIGRLHDLDVPVEGVAQSFLEVVACAEAADEEDRLDGDFGRGDLVVDQADDFEDDGLEDGLEVGCFEGVAAARDA